MKFKVVRFDFWLDPVFDQRLARFPSIELKVCQQTDPDAVNLRVFEEAHCYLISAARDEIPVQWHVSDAFLAKCPKLLCVSTSGAGYDPVDVAACTRHGVLVVNQAGCNADSVAEHALGLMLSVKHRLAESDRVLRAGATSTREALMGREIKGLTLGIVGLGNVGRKVAVLARAFGMRVLAYDPHLNQQQFQQAQVTDVDFAQLLATSDIVSVHCPRNAQTLNMFDKPAFDAMKTGAVFVTTARGGIHDEVALHDALTSEKLSGAGLDVWSLEPPSRLHPLLQLSNVAASFHTAGVTHEARFNAANMAAEQIENLVSEGRAPRVVNPEVWPDYLKRCRALGF